MEQEYDTLLNDGDHAARAFQNDYRTIAGILAECKGRVLDVGGGIGITREWLPSEEDYVVLEPSELWSDARWLAWSDRFPSLTRPAVHFRGFAEALPFARGTFDVVLHLWTLNHVGDATLSVQEGLRVLRPGGRFVAVLEEARLTWRDVRAKHTDATLAQRGRHAIRVLAAMARRPPLQPDHAVVDETVLTKAAGARLVSRDRVGPYLAVVLEAI
jgi:SAM-dependent methyltransferase